MASGTTVANLKLLFGADTTALEKGAKTAKQSVKDFESSVQGATTSVAQMFGVDTAAIDRMTSSLRGMGETLKGSANEGVSSLGKMLSSINAVQAGIAGLGIAAATAAFKLLNEEAEYFKSTVAGANIEMMTAAYVNTYRDVLHDMNIATGEAAANAGAKLEKTFKSTWALFKQGMAELFTGASPNLASSLITQLPKGIVAGEIATQAEQIAKEQYEIQRKLSDETARQAKLDAEIAEQKRIAKDAEASTAEQAAAASRAMELIHEKYDGPEGLVALNQRLAELALDMKNLTNDTASAVDAYNTQQAKADSLVKQMNDELRSVQRIQSSVNKQVAQEVTARKQAAEAVAAQVRAHEELMAKVAGVTSFDLSTSGSLAGLLPKGITGPDGAIEVKFRPVMDEEGVIDLSNQLTTLAEGLSAALGGLIGDLVTGGDAWGNFKNAALTAFADMAVAMGKIIMEEGIAVEAAKLAMTSLQGVGAIAAGAALIAIGSAVKAGLANVAAGNYSAAASPVAASGYGTARNGENGGWTLREMNINVTGTMKADGDQLITVINNTNKRNSYTQ